MIGLTGISVIGDVFLAGLLAGYVERLVCCEADGYIVPLAVDGRILENSVCCSCELAYSLECIFVCLEVICAADFCGCAVCSVVPVVAVACLAICCKDSSLCILCLS